MGMQKSNLTIEKIQEILEKEYEIIPKNISEINRGTANIFKIETDKKSYILKEFNKKRTLESIEKEIDIINFLANKNIKVPNYIKTIDNEFYVKNEDRIIILQDYIEGYTMENNTGDYEKVIESAKLLGKITKELENYPELSEEGIIEKNFSKNNLVKKIEKLKDLKGHLNLANKYKDKFEKDLEYKIEISNEIINKFDFSIIRKLTIINAHGDFSVQQLIYNDKEGTTVIDFETAKKMPIVWEVMRSYSYVDKEAKKGNLNIDTLVDYFKEFCKYIKLNEYDLKYAPHIYLLQLSSSAFGYNVYNEDTTQNSILEFAFFRTNLCKFLYENLEKISYRLINEVK